MRKNLLRLGCLVWGCVLTTAATTQAAAVTKRFPVGLPVAWAAPVEAAPTLDGRLDDQAWAAARAVVLGKLDQYGKASTRTEARFVQKDGALYVGVTAAEPNVAKLRRAVTKHDGATWEDDSIELFLQPRPDGDYYQLIINASGAIYDRRDRGEPREWDSEAKAAAAVGKDGWSLEVAVPMVSLGIREQTPMQWRVNVYRNRHAGGDPENQAWSPTFRGDYDVPGRFGRLLLTSGSPWAKPGAGAENEITIQDLGGGQAVLHFDLSALPKGTQIDRASLVCERRTTSGADPQSLADVEIFPLAAAYQEGAEPQIDAQPLALQPPGHRAFDMIELVRQSVNAKRPNHGLYVKEFPGWFREKTYLEVAFEGKAVSVRRDGQVVLLDPSAYWRYYLHGGPVKINAQALNSEGEKCLGTRYREVERNTQAALKKKDLPTENWQQEVHYPVGYWNLERLQETATSAPPADWAGPDFDDSDWACYRKPYKMGKDFFWDGFTNPTIQIKTTCFRSTFEIPDPTKAGELTLNLVYRGGVRALVNGQEVARGHLPPGEPTAETMAVGYAANAYRLSEAERPKDPTHVAGKNEGLIPEMTNFTDRPDQYDQLPRPYEEGGKSFRLARASGYHGRCWLTRESWERVCKLRDRVLKVKIPGKLLRKGNNVLAVEVHTCEPHPLALTWHVDWEGSYCWEHGWLLDVWLTASAEDLPSTLQRPAGVQVWPVDVHHRLYSPEFQPPGNRPKRLRVVGAKSGTFAAQLAIGTDHDLTGLKATVSDFRASGGVGLPASIVQVLYPVPRPERKLRTAGCGKGNPSQVKAGLTRVNSEVVLDRFSQYPDIAKRSRGAFGHDDIGSDRLDQQEEEIRRIQFFDQLSPRRPAVVPADTCQPVWFSVRIPREAAAGTYRARVRIEAEGMEPVEMPLEVEVADWCLPDAKDFQSIVALEQSPYGVARHYEVEPWSEEHFKLVEKSVQLLGRVGNDFLGIPVVCRTELGNFSDSPLRITRKKDGSLNFDFSRVDRYLDMALKHWGVPRCICFVVDHPGKPKYQQLLPVINETTNEIEQVQIGPEAPPEVRRGTWRAVALAIADHMRSRGLLAHTYWGLHGDEINDPTLLPLLKEFVPEVKWACYSHQHRCDEYYTFCANVRCAYYYPITSLKGWKALTGPINCWLPRHWNSIAVAEGVSAPPSFRIGIERALASGSPGMARAGADYWKATWLAGSQLSPYAGMPITSVLWPGQDGAESSARFEMLCEGVQETEARIFLEQAMEKLDDPALTKQLTELLDQRLRDTIFALPTAPHLKIEEYISGWRDRSRQLFQAAAQVAKRLGVDLNRSQLSTSVPARGNAKVELVLRNWSSDARAYKLVSEQEWIRPQTPAASAKPGFQQVTVVLDGARLPPGKPARGTLTLTDVATGRTEQVQIDAETSDVLQLTAESMVVNVRPGGTVSHHVTLRNPSGGDLNYTIAVSAPWVKAEPATGKLPAGKSCPVTLAVKSPPISGGRLDATVAVSESGGLKIEQALTVHVVPDYQPPARLPAGQRIGLDEVLKEKGSLKSCLAGGKDRSEQGPSFSRASGTNRGAAVGTQENEKKQRVPIKQFERAMNAPVTSEVTLDIEGKGFSAFSAEVGASSNCRVAPGCPRRPRIHFEVFVDGKPAGQSGLMELADAPRLLVVPGLHSAKELRLITRTEMDDNTSQDMSVTGIWGEPVLYK